MYLPQGTILNNSYQVESVLGHGGFGITYAAYDQSFGARVAIKEYLPRHLATRGEGKARVSVYSGEARRHFDYGLKKFMEEAQLLAQFAHHPNVVSARDYFEANGTAYMVMEYAEGVTLKEYLEKKGGRISFEEAKGIMMPVMDALREVHQVGLLHRDISPDNIYITTAAQVRVIDFGAARYFAGEKSKSLSAIIKSGYAPEEQYRSSGKQGPWTDVYAVGATLYKLITGQTLPDALDRMAGDTLEPPSRLGVSISPPAERALLRALAVNAGQRFQNMGEFQQALLDGKPVTLGFQPAPAPFQPPPESGYPPVSARVSPPAPPPPVSSQPPPPSHYPQAPRRSANPGAIAAGIVAGVTGLILVVFLAVQLVPWLIRGFSDTKTPNKQDPLIDHNRPPMVEGQDLRLEVEKLAEKIRSAHLNKDINKWLSCYHSSYPNLELVRNQMNELWKNYDVKEVSYRISNIQWVSDKDANAEILWNIQLFDHRSHEYTLVRQPYQTTLKLTPSGWKIADSKEIISEGMRADQVAEQARLDEDRRKEAERKEKQRLAEKERQRQADAKREEQRRKEEREKREAEQREAEERERQQNLQAEQQAQQEQVRRQQEQQRQAQEREHVIIESLTMNPPFWQAGQTVTMECRYIVVSGPNQKTLVEVKVSIIFMNKLVMPPVEKNMLLNSGSYVFHFPLAIPQNAPKGNYTISAEVKTPNKIYRKINDFFIR